MTAKDDFVVTDRSAGEQRDDFRWQFVPATGLDTARNFSGRAARRLFLAPVMDADHLGVVAGTEPASQRLQYAEQHRRAAGDVRPLNDWNIRGEIHESFQTVSRTYRRPHEKRTALVNAFRRKFERPIKISEIKENVAIADNLVHIIAQRRQATICR